MTVRQLDRLGRNGLGGALAAMLLVVSPDPPVSAEQRVDVASEIWQGDLSRRLATADRLADSALFEQLYAALEAGPRYARQVPTGRVLQSHRIAGVEHPYLVLVPRGYDPERRYPARIYLHGGVARRELPANGGWWRDPDRLASEDHIAVFPASWADSTWWQESQLASLAGILARLKMTYNLDENRVHVVGVSDGGTGAWYLAFRNPTPWAGFVPMIGHPAVLASPRVAAAGQMHPLGVAVQVEVRKSKGLKPVFHFIASRVETGRLFELRVQLDSQLVHSPTVVALLAPPPPPGCPGGPGNPGGKPHMPPSASA